MTQEQLCNWSLMAGCYVAATEDMDWLNDNQPTATIACVHAQSRPCRSEEAHRRDAARLHRCGTKGSEITTYDSLDHSLAQSRNNLYIGTKCWATYLSLAMMFEKLGDSKRAAGTGDRGRGSRWPHDRRTDGTRRLHPCRLREE